MADNLQKIAPSKYWDVLNKSILSKLEKHGYENFKRTVAFHYFTWLVTLRGCQIKFLRRNLPVWKVLKCFVKTFFTRTFKLLTWGQTMSVKFLTLLLWEYLKKIDTKGLTLSLSEPKAGNPFPVYDNGKLISQDLANSILEFYSIANSIDINKVRTIAELGGGYGRNAYVFLRLLPGVQYTFIDLPESLEIAKRYLGEVMPNSNITFLTPERIEEIPDKSADLFINISSFHEMRLEQISYYFDQADRITRGYFYSKQWKKTKMPYENIELKREDYPWKKNWKEIYNRECAVQTNFFEALMLIQ